MPSEKREMRRAMRKARRVRRRVLRFFLLVLLIVLLTYAATLSFSIFGGGEVPDKLREYEFIDAPAQYAEKSLNINQGAQNEQEAELRIVVSEDKVYYKEQEIAIDDIEGIVSEAAAENVVLVNDNAKHVTYSKVYDELERLGIIIEETD